MTIPAGQPPEASLRPPPHLRSTLRLGLLGLVACAYLGLIAAYCSPYAAGSDSSGYLNLARLLLRGELVTPVPRIDGLAPPEWNYYFQQPLGFKVDWAAGTEAPTYPPGFPLHLALAALFIELDHATILVNVLLVVAAAGLMIALGRRFGLPWPWALAAAALFWASPMFISAALQPMSDLPATVWVLAAIWCALRARDRWPWAFAAGMAVAVAVIVRPSNLLAVLPVAVALGFRLRAWLALVAGGLPGAGFLAAYNFALYGSAFTTGYGSVDDLFRAEHVPHNTAHFALWIFLLASPPVTLAALALPCLRRPSPLPVGLAIVWAAAFTAFYAFYYHAGEAWWYLRFILPMFPAVILAGTIALHQTSLRLAGNHRARWLPAGLVALALIWDAGMARRLSLVATKASEAGYEQSARWTNAHVPANAIVLQMQCGGALTYYTDFTLVRWDLLEANTTWVRLQEAARDAGRPIYAALFDFEHAPALEQHTPGEWRPLTRIGQINILQLTQAHTAARTD